MTESPSLQALWKHAGFDPNPAQREAIETVQGPLYLTAGPGSGKTRVLLWRTLNLIVFRDVKPGRIFLGTFTEKAAHQLREGLRGLLSLVTDLTGRPFDISPMAIGTVHSICHSLLMRRELAAPGKHRDVPFLLDEIDQYLFVYNRRNLERLFEVSGLPDANRNQTLTSYLHGRETMSRHDVVTGLVGFFNRCSEESIDPTKLRPRDPMLKALLAMCAEYRVLLDGDPDRRLTDLSLLQHHAYERIAQSDHGPGLFDHVIIDEYQDTNVIQEKIYFRLAERSTNLCVVGDDDQALYRFRGATVDNFLAFPDRCKERLSAKPTTIPLVTNYRSRPHIVRFYNEFIQQYGWKVRGKEYRVNKTIVANSRDQTPAVFAATPDKPDAVAEEVADVVKSLIAEKRVNDPNQIAFLFPSLSSVAVEKLQSALEARGLPVYAPRAKSFIEVEEALDVFGLLMLLFGHERHHYSRYAEWQERAVTAGRALVRADPRLALFVKDRQSEIERVVAAQNKLLAALQKAGIDPKSTYDDRARDVMVAANAGEEIRRFLQGGSLRAYLEHQRRRRPDRPITIRYVINRACSLDWGILDLFYRLTAFDHFKAAFDLAEQGTDEGPICNLSLLSDYLARFQEQTSPVITAQFLANRAFSRRLFGSYVYSLFRLDEGEYEDKEDPFPRGRIPFLTIHQAKGLEFPVVVLGNLRKDERSRPLDETMEKLGVEKYEPSSHATTFDIARMFYVALSRAQQLLIVCPYKGRGQHFNDEFHPPIEEIAKPLQDFKPSFVDPDAKFGQGDVPRPYSFTGDYVSYLICPRRYMMHRRYGFVPSRGQTMIFGNLVHRTIEDLHQFLIQERANALTEATP